MNTLRHFGADLYMSRQNRQNDFKMLVSEGFISETVTV